LTRGYRFILSSTSKQNTHHWKFIASSEKVSDFLSIKLKPGKTQMIKSKFPLISVCIPVFNGDNFIREAVDSILNQTEKNFELLVVDNCSKDQTVNIVAEYKDPRIRVFVNKRNLGAVPNFNRCIELAKGELIVLLPHDDVLLPTALEVFSKALVSDSEVGLAYSSYYIIDERAKKLHFSSGDAEDKVMTGKEAFAILAGGNPIQCAMVRREIYALLGSWDKNLRLVCDWEMWCRIALAGYKVAYFKTPQNCYRVHSLNAYKSFLRSNEYSSELFKGMKFLFDAIPPQSDLQKLRAASVNQWILGSLVKHLIISLILGNWTDVKQDTDLFAKIARWVGVFRIIPVLLSMPLKLIKRYRKHFLG
jgi:glycosyltransferase involved in cell wall biosynthesis